jgi:hypothetical protein
VEVGDGDDAVHAHDRVELAGHRPSVRLDGGAEAERRVERQRVAVGDIGRNAGIHNEDKDGGGETQHGDEDESGEGIEHNFFFFFGKTKSLDEEFLSLDQFYEQSTINNFFKNCLSKKDENENIVHL